MKMYKKSELSLVNGMLVSVTGDIVMPDPRVIGQANKLDTMLQEAEYLRSQPAASPMPSLDGFVRKSVKGDKPMFNAITPTLDQKTDEAMAIMDELDDMTTVNKANEMLERFSTLLQFAKDDYVVDCGTGNIYFFDTPLLGSPLDYKDDDIVSAVAFICGLAPEDEGDIPHHDRITSDDMTDDEIDMLMGIIANHDEEFAKSIAADKETETDESPEE